MMNKSTAWWLGYEAGQYELNTGDMPANPYRPITNHANHWQMGYDEWWKEAELYDYASRAAAKGISHAE